MHKQILAALLLAIPVAVLARDIPAADAPCDQTADPARWTSAGTPDAGLQPAMISAHRGGVTLAPENTMPAYEIAFAYGMDLVEIDVRETLDERFFSMHDGDVSRTTDGTGMGDFKLSFQLQQLNAAHHEPWIGGEYDPTPVPFLEDILELAERSGKGIEFDIKSVRNYPLFLQLIARYPGVLERSYFNASGFTGQLIHLLEPRARLIYNLEGGETPDALYDETATSAVFGSSLAKFTPEVIAAIHDGCGYALPHAYDEGHEHEAEQFLLGRSLGIDGAQVDQPDVIRAALNDPIATRLDVAADAADKVCLVNAENALGLPYKTLKLSDAQGKELEPVETHKGGCAQLPQAASGLVIAFEGDASAQASSLGKLPSKSAVLGGRFGGAAGPLLLLPMLLLGLARRMRRAAILALVMSVTLGASACNRIPGAIDPPGKDGAANEAPPRVEPVIHCAPEPGAIAAAGGKSLQLASCEQSAAPAKS